MALCAMFGVKGLAPGDQVVVQRVDPGDRPFFPAFDSGNRNRDGGGHAGGGDGGDGELSGHDRLLCD